MTQDAFSLSASGSAFRQAAIAAFSEKNTAILNNLFTTPDLCPKFNFIGVQISYSFTFQLEEIGRPKIAFGLGTLHGEPAATMSRFIDSFDLIARASRHPFDGQIVFGLGDEVAPHHIGFCSKSLDAILVPDSEFLRSHGYIEARSAFAVQQPWRDRSDTPFWRGSSTGLRNGPSIMTLPRARLCQISAEHGYDVGISSLVQLWSDEDRGLMSSYMREAVAWSTLSQHRYNIDIDGNSAAWSALFMKLLAGGVVLKVASPFRQWYYGQLRPWVNFAPVAADMSDLTEVVERLQSDPELAEMIARNGRRLARNLAYESEMAFAERTIVSKMLLQDYF